MFIINVSISVIIFFRLYLLLFFSPFCIFEPIHRFASLFENEEKERRRRRRRSNVHTILYLYKYKSLKQKKTHTCIQRALISLKWWDSLVWLSLFLLSFLSLFCRFIERVNTFKHTYIVCITNWNWSIVKHNKWD